ncbi:MAG TPA: hypothetical protein VHD36_23175, partial [Pirellulales bacterium]|nr:hypothetical protein [Pirellulales bacterium]
TSQLVAGAGAAGGGMDLLTAITHEMGNVLGLPEQMAGQSSDVMAATLSIGIRRSPTLADGRALTAVSEVLPQVTSVAVANSSWSDAFLSGLETSSLGSGGYAITTADGQDQTPLPWTNLNQVKVTFSAFADVEQDSLAIVGDVHGSYAIQDFAYDFASNTATWTVAGSIGTDRLHVALAPHGSGTSANESGASLTPSQSVAPAGDFRFGFTVLPGDTNQDGIVNAQDLARVSTGWLGHGPIGDVNADGIVNSQDIAMISSQWLATAPVLATATTTSAAVAVAATSAAPDATTASSSTVAAQNVLPNDLDSPIVGASAASPVAPVSQGDSASTTHTLISGATLPMSIENGWTAPIPKVVDRLAASIAKPIVADRTTVDQLMSDSGEQPALGWDIAASQFRDGWQQSPSAWPAESALDDDMVDLLAVASLERVTKPGSPGA